ncbi:MAG: hypothetical protein RJB38_695 [Pseudomonadota bacterium]|jgi:hypothetical protein
MNSTTNPTPPPSLDQASSSVKIRKGSILLYRCFDIAEEVDLAKVEQILTMADSPKERFKLSRPTGQAIVIRSAPITIALGETQIQVMNREFSVETTARIWDYGVMSILFHLNIPEGTDWERLLSKAAALEANTEIDALARRRATELTSRLHNALQEPSEWEGLEDYTIYFLEQIDGAKTAQELSQKCDITALLLGETDRNLSSTNRETMAEYHYSYRDNDLVAIDWNSALVWEPSGIRDIPDVLEFAVTHLLEMRYYDDLIDRRLSLLYDSVEARRRRKGRIPFWKLSHEASTRFIEFSEFLGRVENSLKVVGDFYLARVFRGAIRRFRVSDWQGSISRKMAILAQVSELLQGEVNTQRSMLLEIIIIVLIAFEILYALTGVGH